MSPNYNYNRNVRPGLNPYLDYADTVERIIAYLIDSILISIVLAVISLGTIFLGIISLGSLTGNGPWMMPVNIFGPLIIGITFVNFLFQLLYFTFFESENGGGSTIGKKIMNIKVVDGYGNKIDLKDSLIRNITRVLWHINCIGLLILILDLFLIHDREQRIGDRLANTFVVKEQEYGEITRQYEEGYRQQGFQQQSTPYKQTQTEEMKKCPKCGKKSLIARPDGTSYCTQCDYTSMERKSNR